MKILRRFTALLLTLVLAAAFPAAAFAARPQKIDLNVTYVNPVYADVVSTEDLLAPQPASSAAVYSTRKHAETLEEAGEILREQMKARETTAAVSVYTDNAADDYLTALCHAISNYALLHTGDPTEGDYLMWQFGGWKASISGSVLEDIYDITITYTITHYTTAEQEETMDRAVNDLLADLDLDDVPEYYKIAGIYDYICNNVTYDHDHPEEDYTLKHTAYAALIDKSAVCQGYAALLYRLALELGVDCRVIAGTAGGVNHGWNIVELAASYYNVDSTWDAGQTEYRYFMKAGSNFSDHVRFEEYDTNAFHNAYSMEWFEDFDINNCPHNARSSHTANETPSTCTTPGNYDIITLCMVCGLETIRNLPIDQLADHNYENGVCTMCGGVYCAHENCSVTTQNEVKATCTDLGYYDEIITCNDCGEIVSTETIFIPELGHNYKNGICTACGFGMCAHENSTTSIQNEVESTCTDHGSYEEVTICDDCGKTTNLDVFYTPKLPHNYENGFCTGCGRSVCLHDEEHTHNVIENRVESTCITPGSYDLYTICDICGDVVSVTTIETELDDHNFENNVCIVCGEIFCKHENTTVTIVNEVEATCTAPGSYDEVIGCRDCGMQVSVNTITTELIDHNYVDGTCTMCGDIFCAHENRTVTIQNEVEATCTMPGSYDEVTICDDCGEKIAVNTIETGLGDHDYENNACTVCGDCSVDRIYGAGRAETALEVAEALGEEKFDAIIIANGEDEKFADALTGSYLANVKGAPILLYRTSGMSPLNYEYIAENLNAGGTVYLLGGEAAIPKSVETALEAYHVKRLAGATRFDTNLAILEEAGVTNEEILIARGYEFADSLSASATGLPILVVNDVTGKLTEEQAAFLKTHKANKMTILGGSAGISEELEAEIEEIVGKDLERCAGNVREATSVKIAKAYIKNPDFVVVAYSRRTPDGLCGGPLAYKLGVPLLLVNAGQEAHAAAYLAEEGIAAGYVLGGEAVLSNETVKTVFDLPGNAVIGKP